jgi:hypothetical protein
MDEQVKYNVVKRIAKIAELIATGQGEFRFLKPMLELNEAILRCIELDIPIHFRKVYYPEDAKGFFLTKADVVAPFLDVAN